MRKIWYLIPLALKVRKAANCELDNALGYGFESLYSTIWDIDQLVDRKLQL